MLCNKPPRIQLPQPTVISLPVAQWVVLAMAGWQAAGCVPLNQRAGSWCGRSPGHKSQQAGRPSTEGAPLLTSTSKPSA